MDPNRSSPVHQHIAPPDRVPEATDNPLDPRAPPKQSPKPATAPTPWAEPIARAQHAESSNAIRLSPQSIPAPSPAPSATTFPAADTSTQDPPSAEPMRRTVSSKLHPPKRAAPGHADRQRAKRSRPSPSPAFGEFAIAHGNGRTAAPLGPPFCRKPLDRVRPRIKRARSFSNIEGDGPRPALALLRDSSYLSRPGPTPRTTPLTPAQAAEHAFDDQIMRAMRIRAEEHFIAAAREPPINMRSLQSLDAHEILRNAQLRHDLLFDSLAFRPVNASRLPDLASYEGLFTSDRMPIVDPSATCDATEMYWECIKAEVERGCRCTRWTRVEGRRVKVDHCVCGQWMPDFSEAAWWRISKPTWASRLPKMITTLREILESLMASTTPCVNHFSHAAVSKEAMLQHEATCPTVTHSLVPELFAALDPPFLTNQARRGVLGSSLFVTLGAAMKVHCAPVRDAMVDDMVATAQRLDMVSALRKAFDCVEVMKLDIANHQVHALRPMLWHQGEQNEFVTFQNYLAATGRTVDTSKTRAWLRAASTRVLTRTPPDYRSHLTGRCACKCRSELAARALAEGFAELAFGDWVEEHEVWPPIVPSRLPGMQLAEYVASSRVSVPEVFKMDSRRFKNFHAEIVDLSVCTNILVAFREICKRENPELIPTELGELVELAREDYKVLMAHGDCLRRNADVSELALRLASRIVRLTVQLAGQPGMTSSSDVMRVTAIATELDTVIARATSRHDEDGRHAVRLLRRLITARITQALVAHPRAANPINSRCAKASIAEGAATSAPSGSAPFVASAGSDSAGTAHSNFYAMLEVVLGGNDAQAIADRMLRIAGFNLGVFLPIYTGDGMLLGA
ncbi:Protein SOSEKI 1 [Cryptotrichosporon argae]